MHEGALFYTIGQRQGLNVSASLPLYVTGKNMAKNEVYVTDDLQDENLWTDNFLIESVQWIDQKPGSNDKLQVRTRHRGELVEIKNLVEISEFKWRLETAEPIRAITPGQSAVIYRKDECLGGGIIAHNA